MLPRDGIFFDDLGPTATYAVRHWLYVRADLTAHDWDGRLGTLVIIQGRSGKPDTKRDKGMYAVQEDVNDGPGGRCFMLAKLDDPDNPPPPGAEAKHEIHQVYLGDGTLPPKCDCDAAAAGLPVCKHRDAMAAVVAAGAIPEPTPADPADVGEY